MKSRPAIIVLAAGKGSRLKSLQHKLERGLGEASVLGTTLSNALSTGLEVVVVTSEPLARLVASHVATRDMVVLPAAGSVGSQALGMGYSISAGVASRSGASGWIVLPADMPMVKPATLRAVAHELDNHPVAYAQYRGRRGHPVGFAAELYSELVMLADDEGARRLVARYPAQALEADDPGVLPGIDNPDDLARARAGRQDPSGLGR